MRTLRALIEDTETDYDRYFTNGWNAAKKAKNPASHEVNARFKKVQDKNGEDWKVGYLAFISKRDYPDIEPAPVVRAKQLGLLESKQTDMYYLAKTLQGLTGASIAKLLDAKNLEVSFTKIDSYHGKITAYQDHFLLSSSEDNSVYWTKALLALRGHANVSVEEHDKEGNPVEWLITPLEG